MAIEFVENHWIDIKVKGHTGRLLVREPNALEGARYMASLQRNSEALKQNDPDAFESTVALHLGLLLACTLGSQDIEPAFPAEATESDRRAWLLRFSWADVAPIATTVMGLGFPKDTAG